MQGAIMRLSSLAGIMIGIGVWNGVVAAQPLTGRLPGIFEGNLGDEACYRRVFDARHLSRNPTHQIATVRASLVVRQGNGQWPLQPALRLELMQRGTRAPLFSEGTCLGHQSGIDCIMRGIGGRGSAAEGGDLKMEAQGDSLTIRLIGDRLVVRHDSKLQGPRPPGSVEFWMRFRPIDRVLRLERVPPSECADLTRDYRLAE